MQRQGTLTVVIAPDELPLFQVLNRDCVLVVCTGVRHSQIAAVASVEAGLQLLHHRRACLLPGEVQLS